MHEVRKGSAKRMLAEAIVLIPKSAKKGTEIQMEVLPLVTCKNCEYHDKEDGKNFCDCGNRPDDWFCADGKRR